MQMYITMIQFAKHKNCDSELPAFEVNHPLNIGGSDPNHIHVPSMVSEIFLKACKNVKGHNM